MRERRKAEQVKILGVQVDSVRVDRAMNLTSHYLELYKFEYIVFINTAAAILGQDSPEFAEFLSQAVLALPGDKNIEHAIEEDLRIGEDESYQSEYLGRLFNKLNRMGASVYAMQDREEDLCKIREKMSQHYEKVTFEGSLWQDDESLDPLVNEINIMAPDVLLICGQYERIWNFFKEYGSKINAGLCFCMEEVAAGEERRVPSWVSRLHLEGLYRWLFEKPKHALNDSLFKKKLKENDLEQQGEAQNASEEEMDKREDIANNEQDDWL